MSLLRCLSALSACLLMSDSSFSEAASRQPNFILCMSDDQGWGDVGYAGHPHVQTPVLDEMAATGLRLDRFYSAAPVCSPTRGSFLTGRHPNRFGCFSWGYTLRPQEQTVATLLRNAGYATGHFGKWHLGEVRKESVLSPGQTGFDEWVSSPNFYEHDPLMSHRGRVVQLNGESSMATVNAALPFLREAVSRNQPFLAVIWFGNPHLPHEGHPELNQLYQGLAPREQNYYAELTGIDRAMGRLREELRTLGVHKETLLLFTSDNGPQGRTPGSSGGLRGAKADLWEGGIRVPTVIEWPQRIPEPRVSNFPATTSDLLPTLLDLAGVSRPDDRPLDGISLAPLIDGEKIEREEPIGFWVYESRGLRTPSRELMQELLDEQTGAAPPRPPAELTPEAAMTRKFDPADRTGHAAWMEGPYKLHRIPAGNMVRLELYHLEDDPNESQDLAAEQPERVREMEQRLAAWQRSVIGSLNGNDYPAN